MKFEENNIAQSHTGDEVEKYEKVFYDDGELDGYMLFFKNGYKLDVDRDEITEKDLKWLIDNKIYIDIEFRLSVWKGRIKSSQKTSEVRK